jgi:hypothetical protein
MLLKDLLLLAMKVHTHQNVFQSILYQYAHFQYMEVDEIFLLMQNQNLNKVHLIFHNIYNFILN